MNPFDLNNKKEEKPKGMKMSEDIVEKLILEKTSLNNEEAKDLAKAIIGAVMIGMLMDVALNKK